MITPLSVLGAVRDPNSARKWKVKSEKDKEMATRVQKELPELSQAFIVIEAASSRNVQAHCACLVALLQTMVHMVLIVILNENLIRN